MTNVDNNFIYILEEIIQERSEADDSQKSYTRDLLKAGKDRIAKKVIEEGGELVIAYLNGKTTKDEIIWESADLIYHMMVLLRSADLTFDDILLELEKRHNTKSNHS
jgi:phosphoribosyl-ATP pyrophosphohydrolase/phosphoribosyl-AMP cyclohydrolase